MWFSFSYISCLILVALFSALFVSSLYLWKKWRNGDRNDPRVLIRRLLSISVVCFICPLIILLFSTNIHPIIRNNSNNTVSEILLLLNDHDHGVAYYHVQDLIHYLSLLDDESIISSYLPHISTNHSGPSFTEWMHLRFLYNIPAVIFAIVLTLLPYLGSLSYHVLNDVYVSCMKYEREYCIKYLNVKAKKLTLQEIGVPPISFLNTDNYMVVLIDHLLAECRLRKKNTKTELPDTSLALSDSSERKLEVSPGLSDNDPPRLPDSVDYLTFNWSFLYSYFCHTVTFDLQDGVSAFSHSIEGETWDSCRNQAQPYIQRCCHLVADGLDQAVELTTQQLKSMEYTEASNSVNQIFTPVINYLRSFSTQEPSDKNTYTPQISQINHNDAESNDTRNKSSLNAESNQKKNELVENKSNVVGVDVMDVNSGSSESVNLLERRTKIVTKAIKEIVSTTTTNSDETNKSNESNQVDCKKNSSALSSNSNVVSTTNVTNIITTTTTTTTTTAMTKVKPPKDLKNVKLIQYPKSSPSLSGNSQKDYSDPIVYVPPCEALLCIRNHIFSPLAEEWVFRGCMTVITTSAYLSRSFGVVLLPPLCFSLAHAHHLYLLIRNKGNSWSSAALTVAVQLAYTGLFGIWSVLLHTRLVSLEAAIIAHVLCNTLGLPLWGEEIVDTGLEGETDALRNQLMMGSEGSEKNLIHSQEGVVAKLNYIIKCIHIVGGILFTISFITLWNL